MNKLLELVKSIFSKETTNSKKFSFNLTDVKDLAVNAFYVGVGAGLYYLNEKFKTVDFGIYAPLIVPMVAGILDAAIKFIKGKQTEVEVVEIPKVETK